MKSKTIILIITGTLLIAVSILFLLYQTDKLTIFGDTLTKCVNYSQWYKGYEIKVVCKAAKGGYSYNILAETGGLSYDTLSKAKKEIDLRLMNGLSGLVAYSKSEEYALKEPVIFGLRNNSKTAITFTLANPNPWKIFDSQGKISFAPVSTHVVSNITLKPEQTKEWTWNQLNTKKKLVGSGHYKVSFSTFGLSVPFIINQTKGISVTFEVAGETFRVFITNPTTIQDAIDNYDGKNQKHIPMDNLIDDRPNKSPYDSQWSWHMSPQTIAMYETTMELCDAAPSYIENNLDEWMRDVKQYCPWGTKIIKIEQ